MVSREEQAVLLSPLRTLFPTHISSSKMDTQILSDFISMCYLVQDLKDPQSSLGLGHGLGTGLIGLQEWTFPVFPNSQNLKPSNITLNQKEKPRELIDCKAGAALTV